MKLLTPLGLIALISIPIIIIIYIIKPRFVEKKISSTYIWKLSLKYKKKKNPFSWLTKSLLLIVQILTALVLSFLIAYPIILKETPINDIVIILDNSCSMNATSNDITRLERAKNKVAEYATKANTHNRLSLIVANDTPYKLFEYENNKNNIINSLSNVNNYYGQANLEDSILLASEYQDKNEHTQVILITDHQYENQGYIEVVDISNNEYNLSLTDFKYQIVDGYYVFSVNISSYNESSSFKLQLDINNGFKYQTVDLNLKKNETINYKFDNLGISACKNATIRAITSQSSNKNYELVKDSYNFDNELSIYNIIKDKFKVLLVGNEVTFIQAAIMATDMCDLYVLKTDAENIPIKGYDLYIYDNYYPAVLPIDGEIIITNPKDTNQELNIQKKNEIDCDEVLEDTFSNSDIYNVLMKNIVASDIKLTKYTSLNLLANFEVMATCNGSPIYIAGNYNKAKLVILAFDIHYSDIAMSPYIVFMFKNMLDYLLVDTISNYNPDIFETINIHSKISAVETKLDENVIYNDNNPSNDYEYFCESIGRHEVKMLLGDDAKITKYFFVNPIKEEGNFNYVGDFLAPNNYQRNGNVKNPTANVNYDLIVIFGLILLALLTIEWGLSLNEQY